MPNTNGVVSRRNTGELESTVGVGNGIVWMVVNDDPRSHPIVNVAGYFDNLRRSECLRNKLLEFGLGSIECRV